MNKVLLLVLSILFIVSCKEEEPQTDTTSSAFARTTTKVELDLNEANRLSELPLGCIQTPLPYKSGIVIAKESDLAMPIEHHPAFYGCFDWHSAVHGHWSLVYLLKNFPDLANREEAIRMLDENLTAEKIEQEVVYFSLNRESKSFERTYGWAWLLKLQEELYTWDTPQAKKWYTNLKPLEDYISAAYIEYLPKLAYPIRVGTHSNTAFGLSFAYDFAVTAENPALASAIKEAAIRFYSDDKDCPISWEPSGYDFLSPCLQEIDIMRKVLSKEEFEKWSTEFLPPLFNQTLALSPGIVNDRSDGHMVPLSAKKECPCLQFSDRSSRLLALQNYRWGLRRPALVGFVCVVCV